MRKDTRSDLTSRQAARRLGLTISTVTELCRSKKIPDAYKENGRWRIPEESILSWAEQQDSLLNRWDASTRWRRFRNRSYIFWPAVVISGLSAIFLFIFALISAGADLGPAQDLLYEWRVIRRFPPRQEGETLIVIANFYSAQGNQESDIQDRLYTIINEQSAKLNIQNLRVELDPTVIPSSKRDEAKEIAQYHNASIIVWGDDTDFEIKTNFLNINNSNHPFSDVSFTESENTAFAAPSEYVQFVNEKLSPQITFLSLFAISNANLSNGNYDIAIDVLDYAINEFSTILNNELREELGVSWLLLAISYHFKSTPSDADFHINGAKAVEYYGEVIALEPDSAFAYGNRGSIHFLLGETELAVEDLEMAVDLGIESAEPFLNLGIIHLKRDEPEKAVANFSTAIDKRFEPLFGAYFNRGIAYTEMGEYSLALSDLNRAIDLNSQSAYTYFQRGKIYQEQGIFDLALDDYDQAIILYPGFSDAFARRGEIYSNTGNFDQAIIEFDEAIRLSPNKASLYYNRGHLYYQNGEVFRALEQYDIAISINPEDNVPYSGKGIIYQMLRDYSEAIKQYSRAIELDPDDYLSYNNRGYAYYQQGDLDRALSDLNQALILKPDYASSLISRGLTYEKRGEWANALADLEKFLQLYPDTPDTQMATELVQELKQKLNE